MIPDHAPELIGVDDSELGAATERNGMVVQNGRNNERAVKDCGEEDGVLKLRKLVAKPAVRGVPQEPLT